MTALSAQESMNTIDKFIREVGATEKIAAEANTEAGSIGGETEHPVKDVDDHTDDADEGFRSKENDEDVKADEGPPSVDNQPIATPEKTAEGKSEGGAAGDPVQSPGSAADDQIQIGTVKEPTGDDPSVETGSVKEEKEDSGGPGGPTSHPATTENSSLDGLKYAEAELEEMPLEDLAKVASTLNNALLAELAVHDFRKDAVDVADQDGYVGSKEAADDEVAAQAGWELAGLLTGDFDKEAADALVEGTLEEIIKTASGDADNVSSFLSNYSQELDRQEYDAGTKQANEEALAAMLQGGGGEEGGMPEEATMDAVQGMGGPETGGEEGLEELLGGGGGEELAGLGAEEGVPEEGGEDVEELAMILEELGVSPEELEEAIAAEGEGGLEGGGLEGGGLEGGLGGLEGGLEGGLPEEGGGEQAAGLEVEAADKAAAAKKGSAGNAVRDYIQELISRSRQ